jgi:outer membrane protein OmpA-like peptidoglycan-associated protein
MSNKWLIGAMSMVLMCGAANAKEQLEKEHKAGMLTGAAMGAAVGGPVGAAFGFIVGAVGGDMVSDKRIAEEHAAALEHERQWLQAQLEETQQKLAALSERDEVSADPLFAMLAERLRGDVLFRTGSAELDITMQQRLGELGALLESQPFITVDLDGFADPRGKKSENLALSEARVIAVRDALMKGGLQAERIKLTAHGESQSTALPGDQEAYAWERRVSVAIRTTSDGQVARR